MIINLYKKKKKNTAEEKTRKQLNAELEPNH